MARRRPTTDQRPATSDAGHDVRAYCIRSADRPATSDAGHDVRAYCIRPADRPATSDAGHDVRAYCIGPADDQRPTTIAAAVRAYCIRPAAIIALLCCLALLLSGCLLASGEQSASDTQPTGGNSSTTFVSAEGEQERSLATGASATTMNVIVILTVQEGELQLEILDPQDSVTLAVQGRPGEQVTRSGTVATDERGDLHYRVTARGARNGGFQVLYQPAGQ